MDSQTTWEYSKNETPITNVTNDLLYTVFLLILSSQYGNAVQDDLWNAFDKQAKVDQVFLPTKVETIMDAWTAKMG